MSALAVRWQCAVNVRHLRYWRAASVRCACIVCVLHGRCAVSVHCALDVWHLRDGRAASVRWACGVCTLGVRRLRAGRAASARPQHNPIPGCTLHPQHAPCLSSAGTCVDDAGGSGCGQRPLCPTYLQCHPAGMTWHVCI